MKKIPHTFTIIFSLIVLAAICTWFVPGGEFVRESISVANADGTISQRQVVRNDSFHYVESQPQTWQIFGALFSGFVDKADIIIFILMVGGSFWILNNSHAIEIGVMAFLRRVQRLNRYAIVRKLGAHNIIITLIMIMFSLFGTLFGMSEETIAFSPIFIPLAISMGFDSIVGLCICFVAASLGFAGAMFNPFTIGIAQGIAEVPLFSGLEYRFICWVIFTIVGISFVLLYANRIKKDPHRSPVYELDEYWRQRVDEQKSNPIEYRSPRVAWILWGVMSAVLIAVAIIYPTTTITMGKSTFAMPALPIAAALFVLSSFFMLRKSVHFFILDIMLFTIVYLVVGVMGYDWYIMEISALFLAMGLLAGIADSQNADNLAKLFLAGCKDLLSAALVVGLASGIIYILQNGKIIDTILFALTNSLNDTGQLASVSVMYFFQTLLNFIMPSGSAKAALTMPIMSQFADLINLSRQTTVLAYQFGDGFTNMITPTSGVLIGCLGVARIPFGVWFKWIWKFILLLVLLAYLLILPPLYIDFPGF